VPAPYLARAKWVQVREQSSLDDGDLRSYIDNAHGLVATRLTRAVRRELGLMI
jgi:predicted DNA-binding protein (MmcQ/YjbR family)